MDRWLLIMRNVVIIGDVHTKEGESDNASSCSL